MHCIASPVPADLLFNFNELKFDRELLEGYAPRLGVRNTIGCSNLVRHPWCYLAPMIEKRLFDELSDRIHEALRDSPAQDIEKNLRALLAAWFDRLDLVLREDFEVQKKLLERAQAKLTELEARIAELEARKRAG